MCAVSTFDPAKDDAHCRLCGAKLGEAALVHTLPDRFEQAAGISPEGYRRAWRRCSGCAALIGVQRPEDEAALERLTSSYYEVDLGTGIRVKYEKVMALPENQSDNAGRVRRVIEACRKRQVGGEGAIVIDIGAGTGVFLSRFLSTAGGEWEGIGIEPDPLAAAHLRDLGQFQVIAAQFDGALTLPHADVVTLNKVVEHISEPLGVLTLAAGRLRRGGLMYVEVPDALTATYRQPEDNILGALHKHLYEPESLAALLRRAGLTVLEVARIVEPSDKLTVYAFACPANSFDAARRHA